MEKNKVKIHRFPKIDFDYILSLSPGYYETMMINKVIKLLLHTVKNHSLFFFLMAHQRNYLIYREQHSFSETDSKEIESC